MKVCAMCPACQKPNTTGKHRAPCGAICSFGSGLDGGGNSTGTHGEFKGEFTQGMKAHTTQPRCPVCGPLYRTFNTPTFGPYERAHQ